MVCTPVLRVANFILKEFLILQVITKPGGAKSYSKFKGQLYALKKEEGGRHKPFVTGYRPQFFFRCVSRTFQKLASQIPGCNAFMFQGEVETSHLGYVPLPASVTHAYLSSYKAES